MSEVIAPADAAELADVVRAHAARTAPVAVIGSGTRASWGRPVDAGQVLSTRAMAGITLYEPAEQVVAAAAGTPVAALDAELAAHNQRLAFEPPDLCGFFGTDGEPTVGGLAAGNLSGPRRIGAGAARDSLIGVEAVNGAGEPVKAGGRVMKNVTGYDLVKLLAGSFGTLAVLTGVTFKVAPRPETERTLVVRGQSLDAAIATMGAALASPHAVTGAAYDPGGSATATTALRLEGFEGSVNRRIAALKDDLDLTGEVDELDAERSADLWRSIRDVSALAGSSPVWRLSVKPTAAAEIATALGPIAPVRLLFDWGGGLIWAMVPDDIAHAGAPTVRAAVAAAGGHATLVRAPESVRRSADVFQPLPEPVMRLTRAVKRAFDPQGILNPGRMYRDM